jgi:hypothetical protein
VRRAPPLDIDGAEGIAIAALGFLASEPERLARFMALSGITPDELRRQARSRQMQAAILDHMLADESLLLVFAAGAGLPPERIAPAADLLRGEGRRSRP